EARGTYSMTLFKKPVSIKGALLVLLLPAGIVLMATAWFVHGLLLERMSREFVESRLKDEVAFLELNIRQAEGKIDMLKTGDYFEKVFHHAFAIQSSSQTVISPQSWQPLLSPLLQFDGDESIRVHNAKIANAPSDILALSKIICCKRRSYKGYRFGRHGSTEKQSGRAACLDSDRIDLTDYFACGRYLVWH
ncbi:MAG TPA: hypothetical protein VIC08_13700, partial [Cellvibrionaceae bacterium]